jgi:hypothetical protein
MSAQRRKNIIHHSIRHLAILSDTLAFEEIIALDQLINSASGYIGLVRFPE